MRELQKRQQLKRRLYSLPALGALFILTLALGKGAYDLVVKERQSARDSKLLAEKVATLTEREATLKAEIDRLRTDAGIEEEIKGKFNVAGAGEHVAIIVDRPDTSTTTLEVLPWYKRAWDAIIGR
ncbi:septum formation initiator family protein [Candidatus Parcubacteria bacterium]|nr:septum formation initiator family protein [Candidatus Parcubacteria bacterium]